MIINHFDGVGWVSKDLPLSNDAKNEFTKSVKDYVNRKTAVSFLSEGSKEFVQENIQQFGESNIVNRNRPDMYKVKPVMQIELEIFST